MMLTIDQAELLGMHAGDGTLYKTCRGAVWELRGNKDEEEFYDLHVVPLLKRIGFDAVAKERSGGKNGCYGVRCCKREFRQILLNAGFRIGKKTHSVVVPRKVMEGIWELKAAFLRGLFATDGCAYTQGGRPYLELGSASEHLISDARQLLKEAGVRAYGWSSKSKRGGPTYHLRISGILQAQKFHKMIGIANPKHLRRVEQFLKY